MFGWLARRFGMDEESPFVAVVYEAKTKRAAPDAPRYRCRIAWSSRPSVAVFNQARFNTDYESAMELARETGYDVLDTTRAR